MPFLLIKLAKKDLFSDYAAMINSSPSQSTQVISIKNIPKVELHRHLDCSWRYSTLVEIAREMDGANCAFLSNDFHKIEDDFLVTKPMNNLASVLQKFSKAQKILSYPGILKRLTYEVVEDAYNDGIRILELRYSLNFIREVSQLSFEKIHTEIFEGLQEAAKKFPVATGLISILQRGQPIKSLQNVLDFTLQNKDTFVGVDLADSEERFNTLDYKALFDQVFEKDIPITIHCGETPDEKAALRVKEAVEILHARRIGHGIQSITNKDVIQFIKEKNIHLEVCPLSNVLTKAFANLTSHPFDSLLKSGISVSINSDDPGIFNTRLSDDYSYLINKFNYDEKDLFKINTITMQHSFIAEDLKKKMWRV